MIKKTETLPGPETGLIWSFLLIREEKKYKKQWFHVVSWCFIFGRYKNDEIGPVSGPLFGL